MSWETRTIDELCTISKGKKLQEVFEDSKSYRYIQIDDLHGESLTKFTREIGTECTTTDVLIAWDGANAGKVGVGLRGMIGSTLARMRPDNNNIISKYLYWFLESKFDLIKSTRTGATIPHVNGTTLRQIKVPVPPLSVQKQIADTLDKADALRKKDEQLLQKYDELAQSIFYEMFGDPVKNERGWEKTTLGEICTSIKDGPHVSPKYVAQGVPFISVNNIIRGIWDLENVRYISLEDHEQYKKKCNPQLGDVLYTKGGTTGFAKYIDITLDFSNWVHLAVLKFDRNHVHGRFLEAMLNTDFCYIQSQRYTRGIANRDLVLGQMSKINLYLPPISLQRQFANCLEKIKEQQNFLTESCEKSRLLFNTLLNTHFS